MRLVAEIDALKAELVAARVRVQELEMSADTDVLVGVLNRRGFERELRRSLAYVRRYGIEAALIYLDLDAFKPVNDRYGHAAGDLVLKAIGSVLADNVRASDVVGRLGGDEFAVLLWHVAEPAAAAKAEALEAAIGRVRIPWGQVALGAGASAGVAMLGRDDDPDALLARADAAMYARKARKADKARPICGPNDPLRPMQ